MHKVEDSPCPDCGAPAGCLSITESLEDGRVPRRRPVLSCGVCSLTLNGRWAGTSAVFRRGGLR